MDVELLTAEHAFVISAYNEAEQAIAKLMELTDDFIQDHWGERGTTAGGKKPKYEPGYWAHYPKAAKGKPEAQTWRSTAFEWSLISDAHRDESRNAFVFVAGATFWAARDSPATIPENADWVAARRKDGFEYVNSWSWRLWRHRYPEELLGETTLDGQAELLGRWVVESFDLLAKAPPPN